MTDKLPGKNKGLNLLGWIMGVIALLFYLAFHYAGDQVGNYYYLGAFFTSLNVCVLCLCFSQVYELLALIHEELKKRE
ncbi:MAG: hypothetical protein R3318_04065 [Gammaproteobacteria bacterium]|nr:hypothetical protein [Gammaproteobacteria bacterium]